MAWSGRARPEADKDRTPATCELMDGAWRPPFVLQYLHWKALRPRSAGTRRDLALDPSVRRVCRLLPLPRKLTVNRTAVEGSFLTSVSRLHLWQVVCQDTGHQRLLHRGTRSLSGGTCHES